MSPALWAWGRRGLVIANILALLTLFGLGCDRWVQYRILQALTQYHQGVIVPMTKPPAPATPLPQQLPPK